VQEVCWSGSLSFEKDKGCSFFICCLLCELDYHFQHRKRTCGSLHKHLPLPAWHFVAKLVAIEAFLKLDYYSHALYRCMVQRVYPDACSGIFAML